MAHDAALVSLTAPKQRALLALLVLREGETVSVDHILDSLWGEDLPTQPQRTLRFHVSKLRSALREGGIAETVVETVPTGYRMAEEAYELDARDFERITSAAADLLVSDPRQAARLLAEAADLWRGPALVDFTYEEFAQSAIRRLTALRLVATEDRFEALLRMGKGAELVPELEAHTDAYPFRERAWGQLMVARYRAGDSAGALRAYQDARTVLGESLGIEPGPELQDLEESVLHNRSEILGRGSFVAPVGSPRVRVLISDFPGLAGPVVAAWSGHLLADDPVVTAEFEGIASALSAAADMGGAGARTVIASSATSADEVAALLENLGAGQVALAAEMSTWDPEPARAGLMPAPAAADFAGFDVLEAVTRERPMLASSEQPSLIFPEDTFRGRDARLERLVETAQPGRVVSVVGPGGVGKTRLALEAARRLGQSLTSRVAVVRLATLDGTAVAAAVLESLGAIPKEVTSLAAVIEAIGQRPLVLLLDNCEHLLDEVGALVESIHSARKNVALICTSRRALEVPGEWVVSLEPLDTDGVDSPAVQLFVDRYVAAGGSPPDPTDLAHIADICRRLDGLPLAIELAATRAGSMPLAALSEALTASTSFLRRRSAEDRQATLTATLEWSMELLDDRLRALFTDLSVFRGPFRPDSAATVVGTVAPVDVELAELSAWSLLQPSAAASVPAYEMLTIVGEHAFSMVAAERMSSLQSQHLGFFAQRAQEAGEQSHRSGDAAFEATVTAEFDNYRCAWTRATDTSDLNSAIAIVDGLWIFALNRLRFEVHDWAQKAAGLEGFQDHPLSPQIYGIAAQGSWLRGDLERAADDVRKAFAAERRLGLEPTLAPRYALTQLIAYAGQVNRLHDMADLAAQGPDRYREMVDWCRATGDPYWLVHSFSLSAMGTSVAGDTERAVGFAERALGAARESGATSAIAWAEFAMGLAQVRRDRATATRYLSSSLERSVAAENRFLYGVVLGVVAALQLQDEGPHVAAPSILELIGYWHDVGNDPQFWHAIDLAAIALSLAGEADPAASLSAAARQSSGFMPIVGVDAAVDGNGGPEPMSGIIVPWTSDEAAALAKRNLIQVS